MIIVRLMMHINEEQLRSSERTEESSTYRGYPLLLFQLPLVLCLAIGNYRHQVEMNFI